MYADTVEVLRPVPGVRAADGSFAPGAPMRLYRGPADVQFREQAVPQRGGGGQPEPSYDARIFLPLTADAEALFAGGDDQVVIHDALKVEPAVGAERDMRVEGIEPLDTMLYARFGT